MSGGESGGEGEEGGGKWHDEDGAGDVGRERQVRSSSKLLKPSKSDSRDFDVADSLDRRRGLMVSSSSHSLRGIELAFSWAAAIALWMSWAWYSIDLDPRASDWFVPLGECEDRRRTTLPGSGRPQTSIGRQ